MPISGRDVGEEEQGHQVLLRCVDGGGGPGLEITALDHCQLPEAKRLLAGAGMQRPGNAVGVGGIARSPKVGQLALAVK